MHEGLNPSVWVKKCAAFLKPRSSVLDLACGSGRHACYLADKGHDVTGLDKNIEVLSQISMRKDIQTLQYDLELSAWPFPDRKFDAIVVTNYLYRPILANIVDSLSPSGVLIYETFMVGNERFGRPSSPDFLLRPNELIEVTHGKLQVVMYESGRVSRPKPALVQRICAVVNHSEYFETALTNE